MAIALALSFPPDLLDASGTGESVWECTIPNAACPSESCSDLALLITAVRITHFLSTGIEDAVIGVARDNASIQAITLRVWNGTPAVQIVKAADQALTNDRPTAEMAKPDTVVLAMDRGGSKGCSQQMHPLVIFCSEGSLLFAGDPRLYSPQNVRCIGGNVQDVVEIICGAPNTMVSDISFPGAISRLSVAGVRLDVPRPPTYEAQSLREVFIATATAFPHNIALTDDDVEFTYTQLDALTDMLADEIALALVDLPNTDYISTCIPSSPLAIIVIYAIIKYGAAYVPLDVRLPEARLRTIIVNSGANLLITGAESPSVSDLPIAKLDVTDFLRQHVPRVEAWKGSSRAVWRSQPSEIAYVLHTSGTTGVPKGVCIKTSAVLALLYERGVCLITPDMRIGQIGNIAWDGSILDVCCTLTVGATLVSFSSYDVLDPIRLADLLRARRVTALSIAVALFRQFLSVAPHMFTPMRFVIVGGEALDFSQCQRFKEINPTGELVNGYGPTEACYTAVAHRVDRMLEYGLVPIGRPLSYTNCVVLDGNGRLVPPGIPGELFIGGRGVAAGYLNRPEETSAAFVRMVIPGLDQPPATFYRTGDLVRWLPSGDMQFERRSQSGQIKIRGQRLELAEVESAIVGTRLVKNAAVVYVKPTDGRSPYLAAFIVPVEPDCVETPHSFTRRFKETVPVYMVPQAVYLEASLPLNNNWKLDRRRLDAMALERDVITPNGDVHYSAAGEPSARNDAEGEIASIMSDILSGKAVGPEDDFFDVGGHSLLAMQLKWRLDKSFGALVTMQDIFQGASARRLATLVRQGSPNDGFLVSNGDTFCSLPHAERQRYVASSGTRWQYSASRAPAPGEVVSHCAFWSRLIGELSEDLLEQALQAMARRQDILRTVFEEVDGDVCARVTDCMPTLEIVDSPPMKNDQDLEDYLRLHASRPFDIAAKAPFRPVLFRLSPQAFILLLSFDHIITDGYSEDIIVRELCEYYGALCEGRAADLPDLPVTCADIAHWERSDSFATLIAPQLDYWAAHLQNATAASFTPDLPGADTSTYLTAGDFVSISLSESLVARLDAACALSRVTLSMALLAALRVVHFRRTGARDAVLGGATANRQRPEVAHLQGFFVTALLYRIRVEAGQRFRDVLEQVRTLVAEGVSNMDAHMATIAEALWERGALPAGSLPLRVALGYVVHEQASVQVGGLRMERMEVNMHAVQLDMEIYFGRVAGTDKMTGEINYRRNLYSKDYIQGLARELEGVLERFAEASDFAVQ
ncbi:acetyl-CoA synthetase-like protein [Schizophyllum commune H4-8]|nr:acetyl-CoA synthetase-like protein [Schizophyllum commune H4-8]KAI5892016.1 acetyl-CoA synthetase-like protein [Schizophyllum commune H4-8]